VTKISLGEGIMSKTSDDCNIVLEAVQMDLLKIDKCLLSITNSMIKMTECMNDKSKEHFTKRLESIDSKLKEVRKNLKLDQK
jgi:hypothetical protein